MFDRSIVVVLICLRPVFLSFFSSNAEVSVNITVGVREEHTEIYYDAAVAPVASSDIHLESLC